MNEKEKDRIETAYKNSRGNLLSRARKSLRNKADAEDLIQDVFVRVLDSIDFLDSIANLPGFIFAILRNRIIDLWRKKRMRRKAGEIDVSEETIAIIVSEAGIDPLDLAVRRELTDALWDAIASLPQGQQAVIEAQALDGMTFSEIAEKSGLSVNTLMTRKRLAIKKLADMLRDWIED